MHAPLCPECWFEEPTPVLYFYVSVCECKSPRACTRHCVVVPVTQVHLAGRAAL